jgi:hypothetical protein
MSTVNDIIRGIMNGLKTLSEMKLLKQITYNGITNMLNQDCLISDDEIIPIYKTYPVNTKKEMWINLKEIDECLDDLEISNRFPHNIRYVENQKIKPYSSMTDGYMEFTCTSCKKESKKQKTFKRNRVVAQLFIPNYVSQHAVVDHINHIRCFDDVRNLRWLTSKDNGAGENKLSNTDPSKITAECWFKQMKKFLDGMTKCQIKNTLYRYGVKKEDKNDLAKDLEKFREDVWEILELNGYFLIDDDDVYYYLNDEECD